MRCTTRRAKQESNMKRTEEMKAAAKIAADQIRAAGFKVLSSGYGSVVVLHDGGKRSTTVDAKDAAEFIRTSTR
jgi:hypothetical protein